MNQYLSDQSYAEQLLEVRPTDSGDSAVQAYLEHVVQIQKGGKGVILIAEQGNKLIGFVCLLGPDNTAADKSSEGSYAFMSDLFVVPGYRNNGVEIRC